MELFLSKTATIFRDMIVGGDGESLSPTGLVEALGLERC
jgi:hypothetical protein